MNMIIPSLLIKENINVLWFSGCINSAGVGAGKCGGIKMRNIHLLEQFMQENGIEYDKPFTMEIKDGNKLETKYLILRSIGFGGTDIDVIDANTNKRILDVEPIIFMLLFSDNVKIIKKPWKPKLGDGYWYVWFNVNEAKEGNVYHDVWGAHSDDFTRYIIGNCFKTEKEAIKHKDDIVRVLRGEPLVKWEE